MKLYSILCTVALLVAPSLSIPVPSKRAAPDAATITALAPPLGFQSGLNPDGIGNCDGAFNGANGLPIKIPCICPPAQDIYVKQLVANVQAGYALNSPSVPVSFPTDNSIQSQLARLHAASVTLQNLNGTGKGCPIVSTMFLAQQKAINLNTGRSIPDSPSDSVVVAGSPLGIAKLNGGAYTPHAWSSDSSPDGVVAVDSSDLTPRRPNLSGGTTTWYASPSDSSAGAVAVAVDPSDLTPNLSSGTSTSCASPSDSSPDVVVGASPSGVVTFIGRRSSSSANPSDSSLNVAVLHSPSGPEASLNSGTSAGPFDSLPIVILEASPSVLAPSLNSRSTSPANPSESFNIGL